MGVGEFLILALITFCIYSLINKGFKLYEFYLKHEITMQQNFNDLDNIIKQDDLQD